MPFEKFVKHACEDPLEFKPFIKLVENIWPYVPSFSDYFDTESLYDVDEIEAHLIGAANKLGW